MNTPVNLPPRVGLGVAAGHVEGPREAAAGEEPSSATIPNLTPVNMRAGGPDLAKSSYPLYNPIISPEAGTITTLGRRQFAQAGISPSNALTPAAGQQGSLIIGEMGWIPELLKRDGWPDQALGLQVGTKGETLGELIEDAGLVDQKVLKEQGPAALAAAESILSRLSDLRPYSDADRAAILPSSGDIPESRDKQGYHVTVGVGDGSQGDSERPRFVLHITDGEGRFVRDVPVSPFTMTRGDIKVVLDAAQNGRSKKLEAFIGAHPEDDAIALNLDSFARHTSGLSQRMLDSAAARIFDNIQASIRKRLPTITDEEWKQLR
jgi:hypothetical protein